jgi:monovalent cation/hydrogen antiporter
VKFVVAGVGGVIVGLFIGMLVAWVRSRLSDPAVENVVSLLTPFIAYLPAEWLHVSGVLAVVTTGIYMSRRLGRITTAQVRLRAYAIWDAVIFLLNGVIFILIGLQIAPMIRHLTTDWIWYGIVVSFVAVVARLVFVFPAERAARLSKRYAARHPEAPFKHVFLVAWTQMRGVVSLAAALALPLTVASGAPFPHRDLIVFVTFVVILVTLVAQGLTLPALIRTLRLEADVDETADEEVTARYLAALAAIERLDALGARDGEAAAALQRLRATFDDRVDYFSRLLNPDGDNALLTCETEDQAARAAIAAQREMVLRLRDQGTISDEVLRLIEQELDHEEATLAET